MSKQANNPKAKIKSYLDDFAAKDESFAKKYQNKDKSIDDCFKFIRQEAQKEAINGCAMLTDEHVYGLAVHYYDEPDIKVGNAPAAKVVATEEPKKAKPVAKKKSAKKITRLVNPEAGKQLSLFDLM